MQKVSASGVEVGQGVSVGYGAGVSVGAVLVAIATNA